MKLSDHLRNHAMASTLAARSGKPVDLQEHARLFGEAAWRLDYMEGRLRNVGIVLSDAEYKKAWISSTDKLLGEDPS